MQPSCNSKRDAVYEVTGMSDAPDDWDTKVDWMRRRGAIRAEWTASGALDSVELGPEPSSENMKTQQSLTAEEQEKRARESRDRIRFAHTGGPVRPLGARE